ncbi:MAG: 3-phosphoshikimate 1-carboxyvinyltransferase [Phycisphaeraceae bacterium]|nr:3-phosphoshikimate 1-carboxyvinyltransferase [Phycisphaeraceae bacterium]
MNALPDPLPVGPVPVPRGGAPFEFSIRPPGSKSLTNRALLLAGLADGESVIRGCLLDADDARRMLDAISTMGARVALSTDTASILGVGGGWRVPPGGCRLDLGNAGTATRFVAAAAMLADGPVIIDGNDRMRQRPIAELIDAMRAFGVTSDYLGTNGCPPVRLTPPRGGARSPSRLDLPTTRSSQFVSALLLVAPWLRGGLTIRMLGELTSASYVEMTLGLLASLGASVLTSEDLRVIRVGPPEDENGESAAGLRGFEYRVEPDASSATYFWAAAALFPGASCRAEGLGLDSLQGDARFPDVLARMGARVAESAQDETPNTTVTGPAELRPVLADMSLMPDAAMTLASVACFAKGTSILRGLGTLRDKECDRIAAMKSELSKIGVSVEHAAGDEATLTITPPQGGIDVSETAPQVTFETYDDHRMAMSLALIGLRRPNVLIRNPACVAKTFPGFWSALGRMIHARL